MKLFAPVSSTLAVTIREPERRRCRHSDTTRSGTSNSDFPAPVSKGHTRGMSKWAGDRSFGGVG